MNCFGALSKVKWPQACELISDSLFYSIGIYVYPYANQQHCLNYCGFVVSFKIIQYQSSNCVLFLKIVLDILSPLCSYMIFRINLTTSGKKKHLEFWQRLYYKYTDQFGEYCLHNSIVFLPKNTRCLSIYLDFLSFLSVIFCIFPCTSVSFVVDDSI